MSRKEKASTTKDAKDFKQENSMDDVHIPLWQLDTDKKSDQSIFFHQPDEPYGCLSQWYPSSFKDPESDQFFNCAEQWMMYHKALTFSDTETAQVVMKKGRPSAQKALGRQVRGFVNEEWDKIKYDGVVRGNTLKFTQCLAPRHDTFVYPPTGKSISEEHVSLQELLLASGEATLAEASGSDQIWGIGFNATTASRQARTHGGQNLLGKALMEVWKQLRDAATVAAARGDEEAAG